MAPYFMSALATIRYTRLPTSYLCNVTFTNGPLSALLDFVPIMMGVFGGLQFFILNIEKT